MEYQSYVLSQVKACNHSENKLISGVGRLSAGCSCATQLNVDGPLPGEVAKWKINPCAVWEVSENQTPAISSKRHLYCCHVSSAMRSWQHL